MLKKSILLYLTFCLCALTACTKELDVDAKGEFIIGGGVSGSMHPK